MASWRCLLRVNRVVSSPRQVRPYYPSDRTFSTLTSSSEECQVRTLALQPNRERLTIFARKVQPLPVRTHNAKGRRHADTARIRGYCLVRIVRNYRACCRRSVGPNHAARSDGWRHAKDFIADGRPGAGLYDAACRSDDRGRSAGRATHASGNRISLCPGRRLRASRTRSADPYDQGRRWLPNTARNAPCGWEARRHQVQNSYHLCCGEGKAPRISSLITCEAGARLLAASCSRIIKVRVRPGDAHARCRQISEGRLIPALSETGADRVRQRPLY